MMPLPYDEIQIDQFQDAEGVDDEKRDEPPLLAAARRVPESVAFEQKNDNDENERYKYTDASDKSEGQRVPRVSISIHHDSVRLIE